MSSGEERRSSRLSELFAKYGECLTPEEHEIIRKMVVDKKALKDIADQLEWSFSRTFYVRRQAIARMEGAAWMEDM